MRNLLSLNKIALTVAVAGALTLTGCSSSNPTADDAPAPAATSSSTPAASATPAVVEGTSETPSAVDVPEGAHFASAADDPWPLHVESSTVKAGSELRVYGETLTPGVTGYVYGAQQMAMPSYNAAEDMYYQVGEEVILTEKINITADANGKYEVKLPIPAGTAPQLLNVVLVLSDGGGNLVQTTVV